MSDKTGIEWTDATWNPVTGCTKVSPGCDHCYAETFAERWRGIPGHHFERGFDLVLRPERLEEPKRWKRPRRVFVNSMSDLFHRRGRIRRVPALQAVAEHHERALSLPRLRRLRTPKRGDRVMIECQLCRRTPFDGPLYRVNAKGIEGIFRCRRHLGDVKPDKTVQDICEAIAPEVEP